MCEALKELLKEEIAQEVEKGVKEGVAREVEKAVEQAVSFLFQCMYSYIVNIEKRRTINQWYAFFYLKCLTPWPWEE